MANLSKKQNILVTTVFLSLFVALGFYARAHPPAFDFADDTQGWELLEGENVALEVFVDDTTASSGEHSLGVDMQFPGEAGVYTYINRDDTSIYRGLEFDVYLPEDAPEDVSCYLFLQDAEWLWYQTRLFSLSPGEWRTISASLLPQSMDWASEGHSQPWSLLSRANLNAIGIKVLSNEEYSGQFNIDSVTFTRNKFPEHERSADRLSVGEKLELTTHLPSVYRNPFDPDEVSFKGVFTGPSGEEIAVPGFFYQDYERRIVEGEDGRRLEALDPEGAPSWKVRFTPVEPGLHSYKLIVRDDRGRRTTERRKFEVEPGDPPGFVRTDPDGGKGFELDCGSYFYPIGWNYRSPYDTRYEENMLGERITDPTEACAASNVALDDGTFGYEESMEDMAEHGMNFMETWMAAWWLAIEWSPQRIGFRGAGRYNLRNAWKLDRVMDFAAANDIYVQLVLINHGKLSSFIDPEWQDHPYNVANGGFLESPEEVFVDKRARQLTKNKLRYVVARWGYSPNVFSWNILNEMNLVGDSLQFWRSDAITEWFEEMALYLKEIDPWDHMVTGHFNADCDSDIFRLEEVDYTGNNAYYEVRETDLLTRMHTSYNFHQRFDKPLIFGEYGGEWYGGRDRNLERDLQMGLWAGYTMPIAATPLFWWNQMVRDQDWYYKYDSLAQFEVIVGEDRRNMDIFEKWELVVEDGDAEEDDVDHGAAGQMMHCPEAGAYIGWFYNENYLEDLTDDLVLEEITGAALRLTDIREGDYSVLLWDTQNGEVAEEEEIALESGDPVSLPVFRKDTAIYLKRHN